jgi:hypothetical protein
MIGVVVLLTWVEMPFPSSKTISFCAFFCFFASGIGVTYFAERRCGMTCCVG